MQLLEFKEYIDIGLAETVAIIGENNSGDLGL